MKCFFIAEFEREAKNQDDHCLPFLNISSSSRVTKVLKMSSFRSKSARKSCQNQSKAIKFVMSCAGYVDWMKK